MVAVMKTVEAISKDKRNQQQGFIYRGIDDVYGELHRRLSDAGIYCRPEVLKREHTERQSKSGGVLYSVTMHMRYHMTADDGSSVVLEAIGEGMDSADKATNKAMAIAHKYALLQAFLIPTEDMPDPDASSPDPAPSQPRQAAPKPAAQKPAQPAQKPAQAANHPPVTQKMLLSGACILDSSEVTGTSAKGPWTLWVFTLNNGMEVKTFNSELAQAALVLVSDKADNPCDIEVGPGRKEGSIELLSVVPADDIPT